DDAILEGERGETDAVVLEPELGEAEAPGQPVGADERRPADLPADRRRSVEREELGVAPHAGRPPRDGLAGERAAHPLVVVFDLQRAEALLADVHGGLVVDAAALATGEALHQSHAGSSLWAVHPGRRPTRTRRPSGRSRSPGSARSISAATRRHRGPRTPAS